MAAGRENLQTILEVHGQEFLKSFSNISGIVPSDNSGVHSSRIAKQEVGTLEDMSPEWTGFSSSDVPDTEKDSCIGTEEIPSLKKRKAESNPEVVIFKETSSQRISFGASSRSFMSSKVTKVNHDISRDEASQNNNDDGDDVDITNARNDALLHQLVHTQLLSGSLRADLNLSHAQRQKVLEGRISELAGSSKLGKGKLAVRTDEKNKAAKRIRDGMRSKQKEREKARLDEAKNLGNYHPTLKKLFAASSPMLPRKRDRGLKMGVGKFSGGILKLSNEDMTKVGRDSHPGRSKVGKHIKGK